jgi:hypothetical protein
MAKSGLSGSSEVVRVLKVYEKDLFKQLKKNINSELKPILNPIEGEINSSVTSSLRSTMRGMFHDGRTGWSGVKVSPRVSVRPKDLVFIEGKGRNAGMDTQLGFEYAELGGIERRAPRAVSKGWGISTPGYHSYIYNGQGKAFNRKLTSSYGKPGRFLWIRVLKRKPEIEQKVEKIADEFGIKISRRLK